MPLKNHFVCFIVSFIIFLWLLMLLMVCFLLPKNNPTINRHFLTSIKIPGYEVPLTKIIFTVLIGIFDVNSDIFEGPWPYRKPTRNPKLTLRCKWKTKILHCEHIFMIDNLSNLSIQVLKTCQKHSPKLDLGLLRIYSLQATTCHWSAPYMLPTTSMTSEGKHNILIPLGLLTGTPF